ncbi:Gasdermin-A [Ophiophagus hannah]|uniref:Gasdermin-A n=1 Tax=Ophiophagus hannah TaxID=8665 RepID=V8NN51_OPHHA|nr:Gasdermin-A [Ophiophagus hannah]
MTFYNATKSLAKTIDSQGDWVPVPSLIDQNNFRPFCLLQKKKKTSWWQSCPFHKTDYQLHHLLLSGNDTSSLGFQVEQNFFVPNKKYFFELIIFDNICSLVQKNSELFTLEETVDGTLKGDISGITDTEITSAVSISHEMSVKMKKMHVPIEDLDSFMKEKGLGVLGVFQSFGARLGGFPLHLANRADTKSTVSFPHVGAAYCLGQASQETALSDRIKPEQLRSGRNEALESAVKRFGWRQQQRGCDKKINNEHPFIKQSKKLQRNLYLIIASAEAVETTTFGESNKVESSIFHKAYIKLSLEGARDRKKIITIPKGCILVFKAKKLFIGEETVGISYYSTDKTGTFAKTIRSSSDFNSFVSVWKDCKKNLRKEVEQEYVPFSLMSSNLRGIFLTSFVVLMKKSDLLEKLELQVKKFLLLILWFIYFASHRST